MKEYTVAVVGATGAVGRMMITVLEERNFPVKNIRFFASPKSKGIKLPFKGEEIPVEVLEETKSFKGIDIALFSAGAQRSLDYAPLFARDGAVVIDNSSAWRMDPEVPLVVPEVNPHAVAQYKNKGIIANPNCSTIQMVVALKPLHDYAKIKRIVVSTYQSVSGAGQKAIAELEAQVRAWCMGEPMPAPKYLPQFIAFNCIPQIDVFLPNRYTKEEMKMVEETKKIMEDDTIRVTSTTVRVPVFYGHAEAVNIETEKKLTVEKAIELLEKAPGVVVFDNPEKKVYPLQIEVAGRDEVFVGRIREDFSIENGLNLWIVADNLRKGAATNAVQIAELLIKDYL
ncbi:aspartate-semialdehyde dehydrogenase [Thermodesulfobacterium commune]|uniref:Aspartate-semialdehyde dehydrogenase n=1 Tax=Thermodesulfobacterium commune DSM 2178 TaxID=289377 RepID=A0A075WTS4_9BACT|nr:aspartate-semialdehyde dehydrogenase [Thermodesulfobacterium commune]AIH03788.1 aspartate-semialdehyde dehydrogenase [Thermodesulfobacterium commune DSM 2178]MDK2861931.1 aspartate-semialdehyde dehydrogenase [Thermodesulfobacterium sp.]HCE79620.1 aspartate-semialdehyde dehydrogenase [Thermodesulfobacterium commune]